MRLKEQLLISAVLVSYCKNNRYADEEFVLKVLKIINSSRRNQDYVKNIEIGSETSINAASYDYPNRELMVSLSSKKENVFVYNLLILQIILHECEHVEQYKISTGDDESIKRILLTEALYPSLLAERLQSFDVEKTSHEELIRMQYLMGYATIRKDMYTELYGCLPSERMAELDSFKYMLSLINKCLHSGIREQKEGYEKVYASRKLVGYEKKDGVVTCPTHKFYSEISKINGDEEFLYKNISRLEEKSKHMTLERRLYYGLPINSDEYRSTLRQIIR